MEQFINQIISNLESNGFPGKRVSLPMEKMFEIADAKGFSFNAVLDKMKEDKGIESEITDEKVIFSQAQIEESTSPFDNFDFSSMADMFKGADKGIMAKAQEMMSKMDPQKLKEMQDQFMNMSEDEKQKIMQKGRDMGIL